MTKYNHKYKIVYTFSTSTGDFGHSETDIETDVEIETQEQLKEISRQIAKNNSGMVQIAINKVTELKPGDDA